MLRRRTNAQKQKADSSSNFVFWMVGSNRHLQGAYVCDQNFPVLWDDEKAIVCADCRVLIDLTNAFLVEVVVKPGRDPRARGLFRVETSRSSMLEKESTTERRWSKDECVAHLTMLLGAFRRADIVHVDFPFSNKITEGVIVFKGRPALCLYEPNEAGSSLLLCMKMTSRQATDDPWIFQLSDGMIAPAEDVKHDSLVDIADAISVPEFSTRGQQTWQHHHVGRRDRLQLVRPKDVRDLIVRQLIQLCRNNPLCWEGSDWHNIDAETQVCEVVECEDGEQAIATRILGKLPPREVRA